LGSEQAIRSACDAFGLSRSFLIYVTPFVRSLCSLVSLFYFTLPYLSTSPATERRPRARPCQSCIHTHSRRVLHIQTMYIRLRARKRTSQRESEPASLGVLPIPLFSNVNLFPYPFRNLTLPNELTARRHDASRLQQFLISIHIVMRAVQQCPPLSFMIRDANEASPALHRRAVFCQVIDLTVFLQTQPVDLIFFLQTVDFAVRKTRMRASFGAEVVRKFALYSGSEGWSVFIAPGWHLICTGGRD